ncbi:MAG TPA: class F sortase [Acidimicrobiales bacterium]|nr:class F sortase [Acidimicrobiales bacterium]
MTDTSPRHAARRSNSRWRDTERGDDPGGGAPRHIAGRPAETVQGAEPGHDDYVPRHRHGYVPRHGRPSAWRRVSPRTRLAAGAAAGLLVAAAIAGVLAVVGAGDERLPTSPTASASETPDSSGDGSAGTAGSSHADGDRPATTGADTADAVGSGVPGPGAMTGIPAVERPDRPLGAPTVVIPIPAAPVAVEVPAIGVGSDLMDLHLDDEGALEAPADYARAGWFVDGPQPGQPGPSVIAGHVDSRDGPAVFFRLHELAEGDEVLVRRADGTTVRFAVTGVEQYAKDAFPTDAVYGPVPGPELRLITCGGEFDTEERSYRDNIVVYAAALAG